jgi:O-antigen/teichoic acid export membrane protein
MSEQPITTSKRLVYNTLFNVLTLVSNAVIGFFLIRFFLGRLGEIRFGVWLLIGGSIYRYAPLLNMGLNSSINWYIPVYLVEKNEQGIQRVIGTSFFAFLILAAILAVASLVICYNVGAWFAIDAGFIPDAKTLVLVVGFCFALAMPLQLCTAVLSGLQRYDVINLVMIFVLLVRTVILVVLLSYGYGLLAMGLAFGLSEVAVRAMHFYYVKKLLPQMSLSLAHVDFGLLRQLLAYGINTFLYSMGAVLIYHASNIVIGIFIGAAEISQFAAAGAGALLLSQLLNAFTAAIKPAVSDLDARDDSAAVKELAFLTQKYSLLLIIPAGCFFVVMGKEFLQVWIGGIFQDPAVINTMGTILGILVVGHCLRMAQHSNFLVLVGLGQHKIFGFLIALTALLCIAGSVVSVKIFHWGLLGVAWSNFLPMVLITGVIIPIYFNWKMHISLRETISNVWKPALLGALPVVIMISVWKYLSPPDSWLEIVGVIVAAAILTVICGWFLSLRDVERKLFTHIALRK